MSAFIVTKAHVAAIVRWYERSGGLRTHHDAPLPETLAAMLYAENVRSVNHRYSHHAPDEPLAFSVRDIGIAPDLTPVQAIKAIHCLRYQSCECEDFDTTPSAKMLDRMESWGVSHLPGYDDAPWCIDDFGPLKVGR